MTLLRITPDKTIDFALVQCPNVSVMLTLENISPGPVAFKIKTTAPKHYYVRPSCGILQPEQIQDIQLVLQQPTEDSLNKRDRFLVQAITVDPDMRILPKEFWTDAPREEIQDHRLNVVFRLPGSNTSTATASTATPAPAARGLTLDMGNSDAVVVPNGSVSSAANPSPPRTRHVVEGRGGQQRGSVPTLSNRFSANADVPSDQETKYNDLLHYCLAVESQKKTLAAEIEASNQQIKQLTQRFSEGVLCKACGASIPRDEVLGNGTVSARGSSKLSGSSDGANASTSPLTFRAWQVVAIVMAVVFLLKMSALL